MGENWDIEVEELEGSKVAFEASVPEDRVETARDKATDELQDEVDEPGFRQGNVPQGMIRKKYRPQFLQKVAEILVPAACREVYQREELEPVAEPEVTDFDFEDGFSFEAEVEVRPEVNLKPEDYTGLELETEDWSVDEADVEETLEELRGESSKLEPIPITRPVQEGDFVDVDLQGFDASNNPIPGTEEEGTVLEIGSETSEIMAEIGEGLLGAQEGENRRVRVNFPEDFIDDELAGEEVWFDVGVNEIMEQQSLDLEDDEFLEERGVESLDELRDQIRGNLEDVAEDNRRQALANQVYETLLESVKVEIPQGMLEREKENMAREFEERLESQGHSLESYLEEEGQSKDDFLDEVEPEAKRRIKLTMIFQAIAEQEEISLSDDEFEQELSDWLDESNIPMGPDEFMEQYEEEEVVSNLRHQKRDEKVLDYLIEKAEVKIEESDTGDAAEDSEEE